MAVGLCVAACRAEPVTDGKVAQRIACAWLSVSGPDPADRVLDMPLLWEPSWVVSVDGIGQVFVTKADGRVWAAGWDGVGNHIGFCVRPSDLVDADALLLEMRQGTDAVSRTICGRLKSVLRREAGPVVTEAQRLPLLREALCRDLDGCLGDSTMRWPAEEVTAALARLLTPAERALLKRTHWDQRSEVAGRYLLESRFPTLVAHASPTRPRIDRDPIAASAHLWLAFHHMAVPPDYRGRRHERGVAFNQYVDGVRACSSIEMELDPWTGLQLAFMATDEPVHVSTVPKISRSDAMAIAKRLAPMAALEFVNSRKASVTATLFVGHRFDRPKGAKPEQVLLWEVEVALGRVKTEIDGPHGLGPDHPPDPKVLTVSIDAQTGQVDHHTISLAEPEVGTDGLTEGLPTIHQREHNPP